MNYQNIPRDLKVVKRAFVPKRGSFSFFDYSQIEPRLFAYFASKLGDDSLAAQYRAGLDVYQNLADEVGCTRQDAKVLFLSQMYGGTRRTIAKQLNISQDEAHDLSNRFHAAWPVLRMVSNPEPKSNRWRDYRPGAIQRVIAKRGYLKTPWGRHLHPEQYGEHKMLNKLIQGSAADLMKAALVRVDRWIQEAELPPASRMVSVIHDEIIFDGPEHEIPELHEVVPALMREDWLHEVVPIEVDHEISLTNWAEKIDYAEWQAGKAVAA